MTPEQALLEAQTGQLRPLYLVVGAEQYLQDRVLRGLREAALRGGTPGLNEDQLVASDAGAGPALALARTLPMMAPRRWVLVRGLERWEARRGGNDRGRSSPLDQIADYAAKPVDTTVFVLLASKLDKRRRLYSMGRKEGWLVECLPLSRHELPRLVVQTAREHGCEASIAVADLIAELAGPDLGDVIHATERVCLFAGKRPLTEDDVTECVVRLRPAEVWDLGNAVGRRDLGAALQTLDRVYDPQDRGIRLVGVLAWAARRLLRFEDGIRSGLTPERAADQAGAPPFAAGDLSRQLRQTSRTDLESWLEALAGVDLALKGGSKRLPKSVLEHALIRACTTGRGATRGRRVRPGA